HIPDRCPRTTTAHPPVRARMDRPIQDRRTAASAGPAPSSLPAVAGPGGADGYRGGSPAPRGLGGPGRRSTALPSGWPERILTARAGTLPVLYLARPCGQAQTDAWAGSDRPSLRSTWPTCVFIVASPICRRSAISMLDRPSASSSRTSHSRALSAAAAEVGDS